MSLVFADFHPSTRFSAKISPRASTTIAAPVQRKQRPVRISGSCKPKYLLWDNSVLIRIKGHAIFISVC